MNNTKNNIPSIQHTSDVANNNLFTTRLSSVFSISTLPVSDKSLRSSQNQVKSNINIAIKSIQDINNKNKQETATIAQLHAQTAAIAAQKQINIVAAQKKALIVSEQKHKKEIDQQKKVLISAVQKKALITAAQKKALIVSEQKKVLISAVQKKH
jgi:hypothetical protein